MNSLFFTYQYASKRQLQTSFVLSLKLMKGLLVVAKTFQFASVAKTAVERTLVTNLNNMAATLLSIKLSHKYREIVPCFVFDVDI